MSNLSILKTSIRTYENLYSLNDLHSVSGSEDKHRPTFFVRLETTKELVSEIQKEDPANPVIICKNGIGTYACEELALAYAMWISPKFHLVVLRAFLAMHKQQCQPQQLALPEPTITIKLKQNELRDLINTWMAFTHLSESIHPLLRKIRPIVTGNLYSLPDFNLRHCDMSLRETHPTILKLLDFLPKEQLLHNSRKQIRNF